PFHFFLFCFFFTTPSTTVIYTLSLHDALPISFCPDAEAVEQDRAFGRRTVGCNAMPLILERSQQGQQLFSKSIDPLREQLLALRSEEHTSELQSRGHLVCRLLLEKKKKK